MDKYRINIGIFGCVSVGKSTFAHLLLGKQTSETGINKATLVPQVYIESEIDEFNDKEIRNKNNIINNEILKIMESNNFSLDKCQPIYHCINKVIELGGSNYNPRITLYDMPSLNDPKYKQIYFNWTKQNIKIFNVIIFMTDITRGLNYPDDIEILKLLMESMEKTNTILICLMNKCDNITYAPDKDDLVFEDKEQENIYIQSNNILFELAKLYNLSYSPNSNENRFTHFLPISSENAFIYRKLHLYPNEMIDDMYKNKLCINEYGLEKIKKLTFEERENVFNDIIKTFEKSYELKILDTGYPYVKQIISQMIISHLNDFIIGNLFNNIKELDQNINNVYDYIALINKYHDKMKYLSLYINVDPYKIFWDNVIKSINKYINVITRINVNIIKGKDFIDFNTFENLHTTIQTYRLDFKNILEVLSQIEGYPKDLMMIKKRELDNKLLLIYDQFVLVEINNQPHISASNINNYLNIIHSDIPDKFDIYVEKFLKIICQTNRTKYIIEKENEHTQLFEFIGKHIHNFDIILPYLCLIIINRQIYVKDLIKQHEPYFDYLLNIKFLVKNVLMYCHEKHKLLLDSLYEIIKKNISNSLTNSSFINCKQDIDKSKVTGIFMNFVNNENKISTQFEKKLLDLVPKNCI